MKALCKWRGALILADITIKRHIDDGCPECGAIETFMHAGWITCKECGFAILESDYEKVRQNSLDKE